MTDKLASRVTDPVTCTMLVVVASVASVASVVVVVAVVRPSLEAVSESKTLAVRGGGPDSRPRGTLNIIMSFEELWGITEEREARLLAEYRVQLERIAPEVRGNATFDDYYLRRFLRARDHNLQRAESMFMNHLKWRKDFGTDTILEDFVYDEREAFLALYPQGYHKVDKLGRPVYIQHLGQINMKAMKNVTTEERMIRFHVQEYERALRYIFPACSLAAGEHVSQTLAIMDLKGLGLRHLSGDVKRILSVLTRIDQDNYPETLGKTLIINAPKVFRAIWSSVKPMLDPRTQSKIEVCPGDFLPVLKQWVDEENIPSYLGGKSRGSLIDDLGPWREDLAPKMMPTRGSIDGSRRSGAGEQDRSRVVGDEEEDEDDFLSVASVPSVADGPVDESLGESLGESVVESTSGRYASGRKESSEEDRVAVVDRKIRELRKMLGVGDKQRKAGKNANKSVLDDLSDQLDFIMDRVSEILADETVERGSSPTVRGRQARARCCC